MLNSLLRILYNLIFISTGIVVSQKFNLELAIASEVIVVLSILSGEQEKTNSAFPGSSNSQNEFRHTYSCITNKGEPKTVVDTERGRIKLIVWESKLFENSHYYAKRECEVASVQLQKFSDNGTLRWIGAIRINDQLGICILKFGPPQGFVCSKDSLLTTLQINKHERKVMETLFNDKFITYRGCRGTGSPVIFINQVLDGSPLMKNKCGGVTYIK